MPNYEIHNNIYNDYKTAKGIIMAGTQQLSMSSVVTPPGSLEHFTKDAPSNSNVNADENKKDKDKGNGESDFKRHNTKRPQFDTGWLICKGKGLSKLLTLTGGRLCKIMS